MEHTIKKIVACCTLHNFIHLHQIKGVPISARDPNVSDLSNIQMFNNSNQVAIDQFRDKIAEMLSSPFGQLFSYILLELKLYVIFKLQF